MQGEPDELLRRMRARSPAGFAIALHVSFTTPRYLLQAYDAGWLEAYSRKGYVMVDPTVRWGFQNEGTARWSALGLDDPEGVLAAAADQGMPYGVAMATTEGGSRSMASFTHSTREMSDLDVTALWADFRVLHRATHGTDRLAPEMHEALRQMSIFLTHA